MSDWGLLTGNNLKAALNVNASASQGTALTAPGANNTKGAWLQLTASLAQSAGRIMIGAESSGLADTLVDIGVGAASSEQVILENLVFSGRNELFNGYTFDYPIPAGSRVAARFQTTNTSISLYLIVLVGTGHFLSGAPHRKVTVYGANTADSGGTSVDPGGTAHTKGSYSEITASTTRRIRKLHIGVGNQGNNVRSYAEYLLDIAIGAASSEQVIIPDIPLIGAQNEVIASNVGTSFMVDIPAGTRIAARAQCSITDATDRLVDLTIHGED